MVFRAPRFAASQSAGAPRCQTRVGRFERVPASRTHASTAAAFFRTPRFAASQSAGAPRRQTRAGRFRRFPTPCAHASTAAVFFRTPRRVGRRTPVGSEGLPATRAHAAIAAVVFRARRFAASQSAGAPRRQTRAGQFGRFSASRTHASTTAAFFRTPRCVARRTPVGSEGLPASRAHVAIAAVVFRVTRLRGHGRRGFPRHAPARHQLL